MLRARNGALTARAAWFGAITLFRSTTVPSLDGSGMVVAVQIAAPAALAIDDARRFEAEHAARPAEPAPVAKQKATKVRAARSAAKGAARRPVKKAKPAVRKTAKRRAP